MKIENLLLEVTRLMDMENINTRSANTFLGPGQTGENSSPNNNQRNHVNQTNPRNAREINTISEENI